VTDDPSNRPLSRAVVARVDIGACELVLGDPAGMVVSPLDGERPEPSELIRAIEAPSEERETSPSGRDTPKVLEDASAITSRAEHAVDLFTKIAQGRLGADAVSGEVKELVDLLERLDREGRWQEALRVARSLATLLALLRRWVELVGSLRVALRAAEQLVDEGGRAWALHELGTLHLAAEKLPEADTALSRALELREKIRERSSVAITERNLRVLCRTLRARLHSQASAATHEPRRPSRIAFLALAIVPLLVGGAAGAVIRGSGGHTDGSSPAIVQIAASPASPRADKPVSFHAAGDRLPDSGRYSWSFGDHHHAHGAEPTHVYRSAGIYTVRLTIVSAQHKLVARARRTVQVRARHEKEGTGTKSTGTVTSATLTIERSGEGTGTVSSDPGGIDCGESCSHTYTAGQKLSLTAAAADGSSFAGWGGSCSGSEACDVDLDASKTVTARFDLARISLSVERTGTGDGTVSSSDGEIECGTTCAASYSPGTTITLSARQARGSTFRGWGGACSGSETCELTLREDSSITADFDAPSLRGSGGE
jgi:hypothetical protein